MHILTTLLASVMVQFTEASNVYYSVDSHLKMSNNTQGNLITNLDIMQKGTNAQNVLLGENPEVIKQTQEDKVKPLRGMEYSEEDISIGIHTASTRNHEIHGPQTKEMLHYNPASEDFKWPPDLQELDQVPKLKQLRALSLDINSAELYLSPNCHIEWEKCETDNECCKPFFCSTLPKFPLLNKLKESLKLEIGQFCSRFQTKDISSINNNSNQTYVEQLLDSYKRKILKIIEE